MQVSCSYNMKIEIRHSNIICMHSHEHTDVIMPVNEGSLSSIGSGLFYKFMEFENSVFILSNDMYIQSNNKMCVILWLAEDLQIVLSTNVIR